MKKQSKLLLRVSIIIAFINIFWLGYDSFQYQNWEKWVIDPVANKIYVHLIFYGILVSVVSHLIVGISIISCLKRATKNQSAGIGILFLGCLSFISFYGDWGALCDVLNEYRQGFEIKSELGALWTILIIHLLFYLLSCIYLLVMQATDHVAVSKSILGEKLFILMNSIGIICGIIELIAIYLYFNVKRPLYKFEIIPFIIILIPYLSVFSYWIMHSIKDKKTGWYDEKQKSDIRKSAIVTLLISITLMLVFFITNYGKIYGVASILWLPFYLSIVLVVFSSMSIYNFKFN
jgi:hypothetical protein